MMTFKAWLKQYGPSVQGIPFNIDFIDDFFDGWVSADIETYSDLRWEVRKGCTNARIAAAQLWRRYARYCRRKTS